MNRHNHFESPRRLAPALSKVRGSLPLEDLAELPGGGRRLVDRYSSSYVIPTVNGKYVAVDGGWDRSAKRIEWFVKAQGLALKDCVALFMTHYHTDHEGLLAAIADNKSTKIFISESDNAVLQGRAEVEGFIPHLFDKVPGFPSTSMPGVETEIIGDGEVINFGDLSVQAMAMPGHTKGSLGFLFRQALDGSNVLYSGDAFDFNRSGEVSISPGPVNGDNETSWQTVVEIPKRLIADGINAEIVPAHSGNSGVDTLLRASVRRMILESQIAAI